MCDVFGYVEIRFWVKKFDCKKEDKALFQHGMKICGLVEEELSELKKGDDRKRRISMGVKSQNNDLGGLTPFRSPGVITD